MKLTIFLFITGLVHAYGTAWPQDTRFNISENNVTLKKLFKEIELSSDYSFFYRLDQVNLKQKVNIAVTNGQLDAVLKQAFLGQPLSFSIMGRVVVVKPAVETGARSTVPVTGTVRDSVTQAPLIGVSIQVKGGQTGTATNEKGVFGLTVPDDAVLVISFVGYTTQEVPVSGQSALSIRLKPANAGLNEVVVIGYGTQKRSNLTGAVTQIDSKMLEDRPVTNLGQALQGVVPNLNINFADGHPGASANFNIRGFTSLNGGIPLVIIDGVPGDANLLNPLDVESVSVLKDASSAAIYGARAAYGVILITTRHGRKGKMQVGYTGNYSVGTPTTSHDFMTDGYSTDKLIDEAFKIVTGNAYTGYTDADYAQMKLRQTDHSLPSVVIDNRSGKPQYIYYGNTDWWHYMFRNDLPSMSHAISLSGGTDNMDFLVSGRYYQQKGLMQFNRDQYTSYNLRAKINAKMNSWLKLGENLQFNANTYKFPGWGVNTSFVEMGVHALPSYVPVNPDGTFVYRTQLNNYGIADGEAADLLYGKSGGKQQTFDVTNTIQLTADLTKDISLVASYSFNLNSTSANQRRVQTPWSVYPGEISYVSSDSYNEALNLDQYHVVNAYATYDHSFNKKHNVKVTAGYNQELKKYHAISGSGINLLSTDLNDLDLATGGQTTGGNSVEWALLGFFGRINYDYKNKYLLELNGRYDGSSHFPPGSRFGFFPSVSGGWRISEEPFFLPVKKMVSELKIRGSWGSLGNQSLSTNLRSSNYPYIPTVINGLSSWLISDARTQIMSSPTPVSPDLTWEKINSADFGVDMGLFRNHLNLSFDWYDRTTKNMLIAGKTLPAIFGAGSPRQNAGDLDTKGFEISVNWQNTANVGKKPLSYNFGIVLADSKAWITRFDNPSKLLSNHYVGERLGDFWGYTVDGYFKTDAEAAAYTVNQNAVNSQRLSSPGDGHNLHAGDMKFVDLDHTGVVNNGQNTLDNHGDLTRMGNSLPRYTFGVTMGGSWNGFDISAFFQGVGHQDWYPGNEAYMFWGPYGRPYYSFIPKDFQSKIWTPENPNAYFPKLRGYEALNANAELTSVNNRYLQNLAYVRLKNLRVGYSLPQSLLERWKISTVHIYVSCENLFTITGLDTKYIDPEQVSADPNNVKSEGGNGRNYPFMKNYSVGLDLKF